ncbi:hypothetical protein FKW77_009222 [Venturia effusa]|uniref:ubiquitinyl hydrolase 1 n=1 Tax=Venturia effusa TaxID=50376 RepID=A0A517L405_9PEZI|nr:hypothetical protein FKW77_009222 [Venturia effusa]
MDSIPVVVKHQGKKYDVDLDPSTTGETFKFQLFSLTGVEPERQKILVKGGQLKDETELSTLGVKPGHTFMMMGTPSGDSAGTITKPKEPIRFLEDMTEAEAAQLDSAIPPGLQNLGNTCYLNSTLQTLRAIPELQEELATYTSSNASAPSPFSFAGSAGLTGGSASADITASLRDLFRQMAQTQEGFPPMMFLNTLRQVFPQFAQKSRDGHGWAQQDAEEAWSQIVSQLRSKLKKSSSTDGGNSVDFIDQYMSGKFATVMECDEPAAKEGGEEPVTGQDTFFKLNCHIGAETNHLRDGLMAGLKEQIEKKSVVLDRDAVYTKTSRISRLPKYLPVHFMRFDWRRTTNKKAKIMRKVVFPQELDVIEFCTDDLKKMLIPVRDKIREIRKEEEDVERAKKRQKRMKMGQENDQDAGASKDKKKDAKKDEKKSETTTSSGDVEMPDVEFKTDAQIEAEQAASILSAKKELLALVDPKLKAEVGGNQTGLYELRCVITHQGASADSGHYTAFVKKSGKKDPVTGKVKEEDGKWWWFNDEKVSEVELDRIETLSGGVLTSRKYGVATVWLVATLGQRSGARKVSRKQILDVNVTKACETIITPEAPMALRLQSNLLYGVSRVYDQQCGYVLADAQAAQNTMRTLLRVVRAANLDSTDGRPRPDNLLLEDDPAFLPDAALMPLLDDILRHSLPPGFDGSQLTNSFTFGGTPGAEGNLILPSSQSASLGDFMLPGADSVSGAPRPSSLFAREDEPLLDLDLDIGFNFDADGELQEGPALQVGDAHQTPMHGFMPSDGNVSARVRREHAMGQAGIDLLGDHAMDGWHHIDDGYDLPPAAAREAAVSDHDQPRSSSVLESSDTAAAPQRRRRDPKVIKADTKIELRSRELLAMNNDYLVNMTNDSARSQAHRISQQAKKNADYWILGRGLGNVGSGLGYTKAKGPLADVFSGPSLYQWITGNQAEMAGQKRESDPEETTDSDRQKRPRLNEEDQVGRAEQADMGMMDDGYLFQGDDTELARDQPPALEDTHSAMPWNILSSIRGSSVNNRAQTGNPGISGSAAGSLSRRGSRMVSASPLVGRGRPSPLLAEDLDNADPTSDAGLLHSMGAVDFFDDEEFERFGPGAAVDTQTAALSEWQDAALDRESGNFFEFVENALMEKRGVAAGTRDEVGDDDDVGESGGEVGFEELLRPEVNSVVVAAQGLLHVLTLATKNLIRVEQEVQYGDIRMRLMRGL